MTIEDYADKLMQAARQLWPDSKHNQLYWLDAKKFLADNEIAPFRTEIKVRPSRIPRTYDEAVGAPPSLGYALKRGLVEMEANI